MSLNSVAPGAMVSSTIECAPGLVGRVIGGSGAVIKDIQSRTGAKIQIGVKYIDRYHQAMLLSSCEQIKTFPRVSIAKLSSQEVQLPSLQHLNSFIMLWNMVQHYLCHLDLLVVLVLILTDRKEGCHMGNPLMERQCPDHMEILMDQLCLAALHLMVWILCCKVARNSINFLCQVRRVVLNWKWWK